MKWIDRFAELTDDWQYIALLQGWRNAVPAILSKLLSFIYQRRQFIVLVRSLETPLPYLKPKIDLDIRPFVLADLGMIQGFDFPSSVKLCAQRLKYGHIGVLALVHKEFAGYAWSYTANQPPLDRVRFDLSAKDVLFLSDYTTPSFRGQGVQTALIQTRLHMFIDLGYQRAFSCIESHNLPSLTAYRKFGVHDFGEIVDERLGPWRRMKCYWLKGSH